MCVPAAVILGGLILTSFLIYPATFKVPNTSWDEPILICLVISMPTGSCVYRFLRMLLKGFVKKLSAKVSMYAYLTFVHITLHFYIDDGLGMVSSREKMGVHMVQNNGHLLTLFDELSSFLTKLKLCSSKGLSDSHEFYAFLELYNANEWTRSGGMQYCINTIYFMLGEELLSSLSIFIGRAQ